MDVGLGRRSDDCYSKPVKAKFVTRNSSLPTGHVILNNEMIKLCWDSEHVTVEGAVREKRHQFHCFILIWFLLIKKNLIPFNSHRCTVQLMVTFEIISKNEIKNCSVIWFIYLKQACPKSGSGSNYGP